jgi:alpha-L-arabinofuranosidase
VQKLFSLHTGNRIIPAKIINGPVAANAQPRLYASASRVEKSGEVILKIVNATSSVQIVDVKLDGVSSIRKPVSLWELTGSLADENSLDNPKKVFPKEQKIRLTQPVFTHKFPPLSLTIMRIPVSKQF